MMSLQEQLAEMKAQNVSKHQEEAVKLLLKDMKEMNESGIVDKAPTVGDKIKDFSLVNQLGETRNLAELRKDGPVVITFYRGGWCPYCNLELRAYQQVLDEIKNTGAKLVAITPELPDSSLTTLEKNELQFEVLSDVNSVYAHEIGMAYTLSEELRPIYESFGIELEKHNGTGQFDLPLAGTFVVNNDGTIICSGVDADFTTRVEPADVVKILREITN